MSVVRVPVEEGLLRPLFQLLAETGVFLLFAVFIYKNVNKWWGLFLALTLFSTIHPSFGKWSYMARGAILVGCVWYTVLVLTIKDPKYLLNAICVIGIANIIFANFQYCGFDPYGIFTFGLMSGNNVSPTGLMANKNQLSAIVAFSLLAFFRKGWVLLVPVVFWGLTIASSSGGAWAATAVTAGYFFLKDKWRMFHRNTFKIIALVLWFCFFTFHIDPVITVETINKEDKFTAPPKVSSSINRRTETWKKGLQLYTQRPVFGFGVGHWKLVFKSISPPNTSVMIQAHNEYVQGLFEMGLLFPVIIIGYFISLFRRYRKEVILSFSAIGIIALNCIVNFPFHVATTAILGVTWMAIFEIQRGEYEKGSVGVR